MKTWTPSELEDGLLDYLYDELEPDDRRLFEAALQARPELVAELERHRTVRQAAAGLTTFAMPAKALENVALAADAEAERRRHASAAGGGFWARVRGWVMHPAFATAAVALLVAGVGLTLSQRGTPGAETGEEQHVPVQVTEAKAAANEAVAGARPAAPARPELAAAGDAARTPVVAENAAEPAQPAVPAESGKAEQPPKPDPMKTVAEQAPSAKPHDALAKADPAADFKPQDGFSKDKQANVATGVRNDDVGSDDAKAPASPRADSVAAVPTEAKKLADERQGDVNANTARVAGASGAVNGPTATGSRVEAPAARLETPSGAFNALAANGGEKADRGEQKEDERLMAVDAENRAKRPAAAPPSNKPEDSAPAPAMRLWTTYGQQTAAGAWADAAKTLGEIEKLGSDADRVAQERASLKKKAQVASEPAKTNANKLPEPAIKPGADTKGNK